MLKKVDSLKKIGDWRFFLSCFVVLWFLFLFYLEENFSSGNLLVPIYRFFFSVLRNFVTVTFEQRKCWDFLGDQWAENK